MIRRIFIALLLLAGFAGIWYLFDHYRNARKPSREGISCIPADAVMILESDRIIPTLEKLLFGNQMWEELTFIPDLESVTLDLLAIDSVLKTADPVMELLEQNSFYISLHLRADDKPALLFTFSLPEYNDAASVETLLARVGTISENTTEGFNNTEIQHLILNGNSRQLYFIIYEGVWFASFSPGLINEGLIHLTSGLPLDKDPENVRVFQSAGERNDANLYVRGNGLSSFLRSVRKEGEFNEALPEDLFQWTALDLSLFTNKLVMNGYSYAEEGQWMTTLRQQSSPELSVLETVPADASSLFILGIGDLETYVNSQQALRLKRDDKTDATSEIIDRYGLDPFRSFLSWAAQQAALFHIREAGSVSAAPVLVIPFSDASVARKELNATCDRYDSVSRRSPIQVEYDAVPMRRIQGLCPMRTLLGPPFEDWDECWFMIHQGSVFLSPEKKCLEITLDRIRLRNVLDKDPAFTNLFVENFSPQSNIFIYTDLPSNLESWSMDFEEDIRNTIKDHLANLKHFSCFALQISSEKDLLYTTALLGFRASSNREVATIWEAETETKVNRKPWLMLDHSNNTKSVMVQDAGNTLYLFSNTGKELWKRKLDGPILGNPVQVDAYKNGKLQMVFNTASGIYLVDKNGKDVDGFPLALPSPAVSEITVLDYDNSRDYRILLSCRDGILRNYSIKGKKAERWTEPRFESKVNLRIYHIRSGGKDYLFLADENGKIHWLNRRGETVKKIKATGPHHPVCWSVKPGRSLSETRIFLTDSMGNAVLLDLDGKKESYRLLPHSGRTYVRLLDPNPEEDFGMAVVHDSTLYILTGGKKIKERITLPDAPRSEPMVFRLDKNRLVFGIYFQNSHELKLIEPGTGILSTGYKGISAFSMGTLNKDGIYYLVAPQHDRRILAWPVSF